jgi:hypothetical protein
MNRRYLDVYHSEFTEPAGSKLGIIADSAVQSFGGIG